MTAALYILAVKANHRDRFMDFCRLNYKLFEGDWDTIEYGGVQGEGNGYLFVVISGHRERIA